MFVAVVYRPFLESQVQRRCLGTHAFADDAQFVNELGDDVLRLAVRLRGRLHLLRESQSARQPIVAASGGPRQYPRVFSLQLQGKLLVRKPLWGNAGRLAFRLIRIQEALLEWQQS